jgi:hypothetical protein
LTAQVNPSPDTRDRKRPSTRSGNLPPAAPPLDPPGGRVVGRDLVRADREVL